MFYTLDSKKFVKILKIILFLILIILISRLFINYVLPRKYDEIIDKYAKKYNLEKELVYAVINAESRFDGKAVSNKGAIGLMQIMPDTGKWLANKIEMENFTEDMLYEVQVNIELGCYYLSYLLDKFKDERLALCAYNAGSTNVYKWLDNDKYSLDGYIHTIPFEETNKYVKKINIMKKGYKILFKIDIFK